MQNSQSNKPYEAQNIQIEQYFSSLPPMVQETIKQCGISFSTEEELKKYAENLLRGS